MRKTLLTAILLCAVAMTATAQQELFVPTAASEGLRGPVHIVQTSRWYYYGDEDVLPYTSTDVYSREGLKIYNTYVSEWPYCETVFYGWDKEGRLTNIHYEGTEFGCHYIYSDDGRLLYMCNSDFDSIYRNDTTLRVTAYDEQGRTLEISDKEKPLYRYTYRSDGSLLSAERLGCWTVYYNPRGQVDSISGDHKVVYNKYGDEEQRIYAHHGTEHFNYGSDRDKYGNWLSMDFERDSIHYYVRRQIIYYEDNEASFNWKGVIIGSVAAIAIGVSVFCIYRKRKSEINKQQ